MRGESRGIVLTALIATTILTSMVGVTSTAAAAPVNRITLADEVEEPVFLGSTTTFMSAVCRVAKTAPTGKLEVQIGGRWVSVASSKAKANSVRCMGKRNFELNYTWQVDTLGRVSGQSAFGSLLVRERIIRPNALLYSQLTVFRSQESYEKYRAQLAEDEAKAQLEAEAKARAEAKSQYDARVRELVRTLWYDFTKAGRVSRDDQSRFVAANNYPGFTDDDALLECFVQSNEFYSPHVSTPRVETLAPDPNWAPRIDSSELRRNGVIWPDRQVPSGDTYIVTLDSSWSYRDSTASPWQQVTSTPQVHVTILNDRAYFYYTCS